MKIMASGPITSWEIDGETVETVSDFLFLGSKITADGDCSHEIKRCLLLGRKAMTNLDNILKSRDITLPTKAPVQIRRVEGAQRKWCGKTSVFLLRETGMSGHFVGRIKGHDQPRDQCMISLVISACTVT